MSSISLGWPKLARLCPDKRHPRPCDGLMYFTVLPLVGAAHAYSQVILTCRAMRLSLCCACFQFCVIFVQSVLFSFGSQVFILVC